jgi:hypothetical protein
VFAAVCGPLSRLKAAAGALLFDLCTAAPEKMVHDLRSDDVWSQGALSAAQRDGDHAAMNLVGDNLLPLPAFTQVGGGFLSFIVHLCTPSYSGNDSIILLSRDVMGCKVMWYDVM